MNAIKRIDWTVGERTVKDIPTSISASDSRREGFAPQTSRRGLILILTGINSFSGPPMHGQERALFPFPGIGWGRVTV